MSCMQQSRVTVGNGTDEYLEREPLDTIKICSGEISNGRRRLEELATNITHPKFLKA
jgi:hypothetical protein